LIVEEKIKFAFGAKRLISAFFTLIITWFATISLQGYVVTYLTFYFTEVQLTSLSVIAFKAPLKAG
jgi:hypothetical protein